MDSLTISLVVKAVWALCSSIFSPVPTLCSNLCLFPNVLQTSGWPKELWLQPSPQDASLQVALGDPLTSCDLLRGTDHRATPSSLSRYPPDPKGKQNCWMVPDTRGRPKAESGQPKFSIKWWLRESPANLLSLGQSRDRFLSLRGKEALAASPGPSELMRFLL